MNIVLSPGAILEALKEHELAIAHLYEVYAEIFPEWKDFWTGLSVEELQHADWIDRLRAGVEDSDEDFVVERFPIGAVEHSIGYVRQLAATADQPNFILINALSTALQLERGLLENKYFEIFEGDSARTRKTLALLAESTRIHSEKLRKLWQENGSG